MEVCFIENLYDIWFSNIEISNKEKIKLLNKYNSEEIWKFTKKDFIDIEVKDNIFNKILDDSFKINLNKYISFIEKNKIRLISIRDKEYPLKLKNIDNMPAFLYVRGNLENLYCDSVAVIGSRNATDYGKYVSRKISKELADKNINIISGLALGVDKYAHLGALDSNIGKTIAVIATGISDSEVYPLENKKVFERILESGGTVISEFKLGTKPEKYNFPIRNRIISGLSDKIIVVEAQEKSGTLITVNYGLEQGKDIYAVPGNITSKNSIRN